LLTQMLGDDPSPGAAASLVPQDANDFQTFLRGVVSKHAVAADNPRQPELEAVVDEAIGGSMRALLHDPRFQEIDAAWRALYLMVRRLETDATLQIHLLDITRAELAQDLTASEDLRSTRLYKLLVEDAVNTPGGNPWAVLAGNFTFGQSVQDAG